MPMDVGKCPMLPHLGQNSHTVPKCEVPDDFVRMRCDPFIRLVQIPTKASVMKKCGNTCTPKDSLDLALTACYDHHRQWWAHRNTTLMQCETYRLFRYGRCHVRLCHLENLPDDPCALQLIQPSQGHYSVNSEPYRNDNSHLGCSIASPHVSNTERGFTRSDDGLFFNC